MQIQGDRLSLGGRNEHRREQDRPGDQGYTGTSHANPTPSQCASAPAMQGRGGRDSAAYMYICWIYYVLPELCVVQNVHQPDLAGKERSANRSFASPHQSWIQ